MAISHPPPASATCTGSKQREHRKIAAALRLWASAINHWPPEFLARAGSHSEAPAVKPIVEPTGDITMAPAATPVERVIAMLEDDAFRRGGTIEYSVLLRLSERYRLTPDQVAEVRRALKRAEISLETDEKEAVASPAAVENDGDSEEEEEPNDDAIRSVERAYFRDMRKFELLSREEEVGLMRRIRAGEAAARALESASALDRAGVQALAADGRKAREHFVAANLRLVSHMAHSLRDRGDLRVEDLIQEGNIGLMRAVDKWDHNRGLKFSTYATYWIYQAMTRARADRGRCIRLPVHVETKLHKVKRTEQALMRERGGAPVSAHEVAEVLGWPPEKVQFLLDAAENRSPLSLDAPVRGDSKHSVVETVAIAEHHGPEQSVLNREREERVAEVLHGLDDRERIIVQRRFGIRQREEETLQDIGDDFGVTRERIRQLESRALKHLQHPSKAEKLLEVHDMPHVASPPAKRNKDKE